MKNDELCADREKVHNEYQPLFSHLIHTIDMPMPFSSAAFHTYSFHHLDYLFSLGSPIFLGIRLD